VLLEVGGAEIREGDRRGVSLQKQERLDATFPRGYIPPMAWDVEYTDEFGEWWDTLTEPAQIDIDAIVLLLQAHGPSLRQVV
jgi:hypothetical protein